MGVLGLFDSPQAHSEVHHDKVMVTAHISSWKRSHLQLVNTSTVPSLCQDAVDLVVFASTMLL